MNQWLAGFFACAAIHCGTHWWHSRRERVLLVFAIQCAGYTAYCLATVPYFRATTIADAQATLDRFVTIAVLTHAVSVQFYADLGARRDTAFRALLIGALVATRTRELSAAKEEAERANRAKGQFLAHMSHEIRNPLHAIRAYSQLLERDPVLSEAQRMKAGIVGSSGKLLQALIDDVLEMSRLEAGRPELVEAEFDPGAALVEVERMFAAEAAGKGVVLSVEGAAQLPASLVGDGTKVKQVLINLASNALEFTQRGSILFRASAQELANEAVRVELIVADTGIGIAAPEAERIFLPFEQLDAGKSAGGTGLGLAISLARPPHGR